MSAESFDMTTTTQPRSDQWNADDFVGGPQTFTIVDARRAESAEQPVEIFFAGHQRAWRPNLSMRRVLLKAWGAKSSDYIGRGVTLYCDPTVKWGGQEVGGIRIAALSDIPKPLSVHLTETRGKRKLFQVVPLSRRDQLRAEWQTADPERRKVIEAEVAALDGGADE